MNFTKMPKGFKEIPEAADRALLRTATGAVVIWSSLTGKTKTSLVNVLITSSIAATTMSIILEPVHQSVAMATFDHFANCTSYFMAGFLFGRNAKMEKKEKEAERKNALDSDVERDKWTFKVYGMPLVSMAATLETFATLRNDMPQQFWAAGLILIGTSMYIMRTERIPPATTVTKLVDWARGLLRLAPAA